MQQARRGRIINIASIAGHQGTAMLTAYCATKHAVVGLTKALALELQPHGVMVCAVSPGSVDTDMLKIGMPGGAPKMTAAQIADVVLFLATDAPAAMSGSFVAVFG
jgi:NAD(P)-dependent dehydrogenase (short-subunit alcohol dehydrogenase family)